MRRGMPASMKWIAGAVVGGALVAGLVTAVPTGAGPDDPGPAQDDPGPAVAPADEPNILVIVTDDQRPKPLRTMPKTKRWFIDGGRRYSHAVAVNPVCCPSRASIFTGLYSHNNGVRTNEDVGKFDEDMAVHKRLQGAGYRTYIVGKYLNDWDISKAPKNYNRWAIFNDALQGPGNNLYRNETWNVNGKVDQKPTYTTRLIGRYALRFLDHSERSDGRPWIMYLFPFAPHEPFSPARKHSDARVGSWGGNPAVFASRKDKPSWVRFYDGNLSDGKEIRRGQLRTLMSVDDMVGKVMRALGEKGERSDTLAIYTADNGLHWAEHGLLTKRFPYKPSYRVPMMLRWPGVIEPGTKQRKIVANIDIGPTALLAAGRPLTSIDGKPIVTSPARDRLLLESFFREKQPDDLPTWKATLTHDYQYTEYYNESGKMIFREYFNLKKDPFQLNNLLRDGNPNNNPNPAGLSATLKDDRNCDGIECP
jgi:arylsulfatase A-like enzyme